MYLNEPSENKKLSTGVPPQEEQHMVCYTDRFSNDYIAVRPYGSNQEWYKIFTNVSGMDELNMLCDQYPYQPLILDHVSNTLVPANPMCNYDARQTNMYHIVRIMNEDVYVNTYGEFRQSPLVAGQEIASSYGGNTAPLTKAEIDYQIQQRKERENTIMYIRPDQPGYIPPYMACPKEYEEQPQHVQAQFTSADEGRSFIARVKEKYALFLDLVAKVKRNNELQMTMTSIINNGQPNQINPALLVKQQGYGFSKPFVEDDQSSMQQSYGFSDLMTRRDQSPMQQQPAQPSFDINQNSGKGYYNKYGNYVPKFYAEKDIKNNSFPEGVMMPQPNGRGMPVPSQINSQGTMLNPNPNYVDPDVIRRIAIPFI